MQNSLIKEYDMAMSEVESFISWYNSSNGSKLYTINKYNNIGPFLNRKDYLVKDKILCFEVLEYDSQE
ncbi:galactose oxidase [Clostridium sp. 'deep sea']|uniref:galactose oxidase n=1 Tax=Clostridium sp. 'deep sea' TaxID=2779445 RepID=UPI0018966258|nr:galactose oxidase [Clostridium sp. 'deep sea']QOR33857.1 galactose oxidase [Clostridium sp. 'deep sea']